MFIVLISHLKRFCQILAKMFFRRCKNKTRLRDDLRHGQVGGQESLKAQFA